MTERTPYQTVGPFFSLLPGLGSTDEVLRDPGSGPAHQGPGRSITITGAVHDGAGDLVPDALLEAWHPGLSRLLRAPTDEAGTFVFRTHMPAPLEDGDGRVLAPHLVVGILARGVLTRLVTRIYFPDEPANDADPILSRVPAQRRAGLVARRDAPDRYRFDVVLQGAGETVFFDV